MSSFLKDIGAGIACAFQTKSIGEYFADSQEYRDFCNERGSCKRAIVDTPYSVLGARGKTACVTNRAGFNSASLASVNVDPQQGLVALGVQRLTIMDLLASGETNAVAIPYGRENSFGKIDGVDVPAGASPRAKTVGEGARKPNWDADLTTETANVRKIAVTTKVPDEFMADFSGIRSFIDQRLPYMVDLEAEFQLLYGAGDELNIRGIFATGGVQNRVPSETT